MEKVGRGGTTTTKKGSHQWHSKKIVKTVKSGSESNSFHVKLIFMI